MSSGSRRALALATAAVLVVAAFFGATIASGSPDGASSPVPPSFSPASTPTTAINAVQPDAAKAFKLLRTVPPTPMPADVAEVVGSPQRYGRNPNLARQISTLTGPGYVIPGDGYLCIVVKDPVDGWGSTCSPIADAIRRGLSIGLHGADGKGTDTLLVPDDARAVELVGSSAAPLAATAARRSVRVGRNGVATAHTNAPLSLRVVR